MRTALRKHATAPETRSLGQDVVTYNPEWCIFLSVRFIPFMPQTIIVFGGWRHFE